MSVIRADARQIPLVDGCVQTCVTSPPYWNQRDYCSPLQIGLERTPDGYIASLVAVCREVRRVLRDDGTLWLNLGDTVVSKQLQGMPWRVALALQSDAWILRSDVIWSKPNAFPESVTDRPTKAHEYIFLLSKRASYYYDADAISERCSNKTEWRYPQPDKAARAGNTTNGTGASTLRALPDRETRNKRSVWTVATQPYAEAHFATWPPKLIEPCILAGSRQGDLVLDPFIGSGTTGAVCERLGRRWVGCDLTYQHLAKTRTAQRGLRFIVDEASA